NYDRKINKKMKTKALFTILSQKVRDGELVILDALALSATKTREAQGILNSLAGAGIEKINFKRGKRALIAAPVHDESLVKSFRNIASTKVEEARNLNPLDLMTYKYI